MIRGDGPELRTLEPSARTGEQRASPPRAGGVAAADRLAERQLRSGHGDKSAAPACTHSDCHDDQRSDRCAPVDHRLVHQRIEPPLLLPGAACSGGGRGHPGDLVPDGEAVGHLVAPSGGRQQMPTRTEMWRDAAERGQEPLRMRGRGEPFIARSRCRAG